MGKTKFLECRKCGKKIGVTTIVKIGIPHQFFGDPVCINCVPSELDRMRKELEEEDIGEEGEKKIKKTIAEVEEWLDDDEDK